MKLLTPLSLFSSHCQIITEDVLVFRRKNIEKENISKPEPSGFEIMTWSSSDKYDYADL